MNTALVKDQITLAHNIHAILAISYLPRLQTMFLSEMRYEEVKSFIATIVLFVFNISLPFVLRFITGNVTKNNPGLSELCHEYEKL